MAGESPDKAEQQGSSEETAASGGGSRDPRLSVLREAESASSESPESSESSESSGSSVQVDQATAVFRTLAPRTSEDDAPKPAASAPEGDRLKAAVAAWVASADDDESEPAADEELTDEAVDEESTEESTAEESAEASDEPAGDLADESIAEPTAEPTDEPVEDKAPAESWFAARKPGGAEKPAKAEAAEKAVAAAEPAAESEGEDEPSTDAPTDDGRPAAAESVVDEPVDQPTAMFKIVRPPVAPAVDQPTTALKLPQSLREDYDSERTSTFVPLRADIPAERKAEQAQAAQQAQAPQASPKAQQPPKAPAPAPKPATGAPEASKAFGAAAEAAPVPPASLVEAERTRQQPLPPLPPLDLLAELTNTPPPKPNALRTTARRVRIWTPLVVLLLIVFAIVQMVRPLPAPVLTLSAAPTFTFEGGELQMPWPNEGQGAVEVEGVGSMGQYGPQKPAPIASVTKTMTAYVILRDHPLKGSQKGPEIEIDKKAAEQGKAEHESTAAVQEGQTYSQKELLELLMIPSANNVARLLARWDAGSEAAFVEKMNAAAKDLGMTQSTYTDPSGLLDSTVSTPQDQLKLAKAVMQYDVFREIVNMPNVTVEGIPGRIENNNNILLEPGVSGIKTGSSTPAGGNLLWSANTIVDGQNRRILGIVMGAKDAADLGKKLQLAIDNSLKLIQQAQKDVTSAVVVRKGQVLGHIDDGLGGLTPVVATKELKAIGWPGLKVKLELTDGGKAVPHAGKAGDVIGQVSIGTGAGKVSAPVALEKDLVEPGFDKKLTRLG
ncbi:D-alanyl-D-alanine carboxypeptidase [Streptomyces gardneri]|uniref:D-alanyl-D-alanine carboxypeptidase family protein n=1 Tax=Streptomyces gardneri TaxID=66892 RepID=UPI0006BCBA7B|nr:serine hydrolase [Streptomyces gardneri]QPK46217.1 D-alanyl-D-alanine carboxypeptidase [Streptomyces gardneri]WRK37588.1 serine hydrolase [Streptomyces venezuelae]CUM40529.1 D-alanyl-D-alanine carboxypeptidase [Streptomyces venezuelae]